MVDRDQSNDPVVWANARSQDMASFGSMGLQGAIAQLIQALMQVAGGMSTSQSPGAQAARMAMPAVLSNLIAGPGVPGSPTAVLAGRSQMQLALGASFGDVMGAGGGGFGGRGMGMGAMASGAGLMEGMTGSGPTDMTMENMTQMTMAGGGTFARGVTDVRQVRSQLKSMVNTVKELQRELGQTVTEISQELNTMHSMGYTSYESAGAGLRNLMVSSGVAGIDPAQLAGISQNIGSTTRSVMGISMRSATGAAMAGAAQIGGAARSGVLSQEMLIDATGQGGEGGVMALTARMAENSIRQMGSSQNQYMMAAFMDPSTGGINRNAVNRFMAGGINAQELQQMAQRNIQGLGPDAYAKWQGMQANIQGELQEATGHMGGLGFAAMHARELGVSLDPNDPAAMARFMRIGKFGSMAEAKVGAALISNWDTTAETNTASARRQGEESARTSLRNQRIAESSVDNWVNNLSGDALRSASRTTEKYIQSVSDKVLEIVGAPTSTVDARGALAFLSSSTLGPPGVGTRSAGGGVLVSDAGDIMRRMMAEEDAAVAGVERAASMSHRADIFDNLQGWIGERLGAGAAVKAARAAGRGAREKYAAEVVYQTGGYWGGERFTGSREEAGEGLTTGAREGYAATHETRAILLQKGLLAQADPALRGKLAEALKMSSESLDEALKGGTLVDVLAGSPESLSGVVDVLFADETTGRRGLVLGATAVALQQYRAFRGGSGASMGQMDVAAGVGGGQGTQEERRQLGLSQERTAAAAAAGFAAGDRVSVTNALLGDAAATSQLLEASRSGEFANLQELVTSTGMSSEKRKELFGAIDLTRVGRTKEEREAFLGVIQSAQVSAATENLKQGGWLSDQAAEVYKRNVTGSGPVQDVARDMLSAVSRLNAGDDTPGAIQAGGAVIERLVGMGTREYRQVEKALGGAGGPTFSETSWLRSIKSGRSAGGRNITLGELEGRGITPEQLIGRGMDASELTAEGLKGPGSQQKVLEILSKWVGEEGSIGGQQQPKEGPSSPMAAAFEEGFTRAMGSTIMRVQVVDGKSIGGEATGKPDSEQEQKN